MTELELEKRARKLEGETLRRVLYQETARAEIPEEAWRGAGPHSVGLAVYFEMESGLRVRAGWGDDFGLHHGHGVTIAESRVIDADVGPVADVSGSEIWRTLVGSRVVAAAIQWQSIRDAIRGNLFTGVAIGADHLTRYDYPQTLELVCETEEPVYLSAARLRDDERAELFTNHLLVIAGRERLERLGLRPPDPNPRR